MNYDRVYRLKARRPDLEIILNGGIESLAAAIGHIGHVDGIMLGRAAYQNPWLLSGVDQALFNGPAPIANRLEALERYIPYVERHLADGGQLHHIARHILGLFQGQPGARAWRRHLSEHMHRSGANAQTLRDAVEAMTPVAA